MRRLKKMSVYILKVRLRYNCTAKKDPKEYLKLLKLPVGDEVAASAGRNAGGMGGKKRNGGARDPGDWDMDDLDDMDMDPLSQ